MDDSNRRLRALAARQRGLVSRAQLLALGRTERQIDYALSVAELVRVQPGVYRVGGTPPTPEGALAAGLLLTDAVASHRSAAHLLGLVDAAPATPEITVPRGRSRRNSGLVLHLSCDLLPSDIGRVDGLRCTNATRTLIDLGAVVSERIVESALERALHRRLTTRARLDERLGAIARRGRPGVGVLRRVLAQRGDAAAESELELLIWQILRRHGVPLPERQVAVTVGGRRYRLDLAYRAERIFIEGDGFGVHDARAAFETDRQRQNALVVAGWLPLRFTWRQARRSEDNVASQVRQALGLRRPGSRRA